MNEAVIRKPSNLIIAAACLLFLGSSSPASGAGIDSRTDQPSLAGAPHAQTIVTQFQIPGVTTHPIRLDDNFVLLYFTVARNDVPGSNLEEIYLFGLMQNVSDHPAVPPLVNVQFLGSDGQPATYLPATPSGANTDTAQYEGIYRWAASRDQIPIDEAVDVLPGSLGNWSTVKITSSPATWGLGDYDPAGLQIRYGVPENTDTPHSVVIFNYGNVTLTPKYYEEYYDAAGRFVGSCSENTNLRSLAPGASLEIPLQGGSCVVLDVGKRASTAGGPLTIRFSVGLASPRTSP